MSLKLRIDNENRGSSTTVKNQGLVCNFRALLAESQPQNVHASLAFVTPSRPPRLPPPSPSPQSPPPSLPSPSPSAPHPSPPPPPPPPSTSSKSPPSPSHPAPQSRSPPARKSPPPRRVSPTPPRSISSPPPSPRHAFRGSSSNGSRTGQQSPSSTMRNGHAMNTGQKIGLFFVGIAVILQIGVVGFLVFKRRQLLRIQDRYETCSS
ncbi:hypothetical protein GH714_018781 [Hevea brasiliensis]|uniref:Uncharacterized protein n=1 Tax=Hevea brasiliensis TaxID=3981 RepID=A0A6A6LIZ6_HEVBR|nr:hypothetical protein GH714_018781 [Hevea brasiliensis]